MKKFALMSVSLLMALMPLTSCSSDDDPKKVGPVAPLFSETVYTAENGLELTYSGAPMLGKTVKFTPDANDGTKGSLTLYSTFDLSAIPVDDALEPAPIAGPGVIPGSAETVLDIKLEGNSDNASFSGSSENLYCRFNYNGEISKEGLKLNITDVKLNNTSLCANWKLTKYAMDDETYEISANPIHIVWESGANINLFGSPLPVSDLLKLLMAMPLLNDMTLTLPDALNSVLNDVSFLEDGNIQATYLDAENGATEFAKSPLNLMQYVLNGSNSMLLFINPQAVIAADAENNPDEPENPDSPAKAMSRDGETAEPAFDIDALLPNIMAQLVPMLSTGVPMAYNIDGEKLCLYLDTDILLPLLKQNVLPLLRNEEFVKSIIDMVAADPDMGYIAMFLPDMLTSIADVIDQTTRLQVGLNFDGRTAL